MMLIYWILGKPLPKSTTLTYYGETLNLIENDANITGWNGPYLSGEYSDGTNAYGKWIRRSIDGSTKLRIIKYRSLDSSNCTDTDCYIWILSDLSKSSLSTIKKIDIQIDGIENATEGNLRYSEGSSTYDVNYKYSPINKSLAFP